MKEVTYNINSKDSVSKQNFEIPESTSSAINLNEWFIGDDKIITVKSGKGSFGAFFKYFSGLKIGDIVEISAEVYCHSGDFPKVAIDNQSNVNRFSYSIYEKDKILNNWIPVNAKYVSVYNDTKLKVLCGVWTNDVSHFSIRNLSITIKSNSNINQMLEKNFVIAKLNGELKSLEDYSHEKLTFSSVNDYTCVWTFETPLNANKKPINFVSNDAANTVSLQVTSVGDWNFAMRAKDLKTGELIKIADIPNGNYVSVCLKQLY